VLTVPICAADESRLPCGMRLNATYEQPISLTSPQTSGVQVRMRRAHVGRECLGRLYCELLIRERRSDVEQR
jgi:hypothetical protein